MHSGLQGKSPCCHEDSSPEVRNQVFQVQFALQKDKRSSLFSSSAESASACGAQKHSCDSPHWRTLSATQVHHQASPRGNGKGSKMLGEFYQSQPPWSAVLTGYQTGRDCPRCSKGKAMPAAHSTAEGTSAASALTPPGRELIQTAQRAGSSSTLALT